MLCTVSQYNNKVKFYFIFYNLHQPSEDTCIKEKKKITVLCHLSSRKILENFQFTS